jgi:hypothetical protein
MNADEPGDDWQCIWDERANGLCETLGASIAGVWHARHPFALGGQADLVAFDDHIEGRVYVTAELTGKPGCTYADYELMICHRDHTIWGADIISRLAPYTQQAYIGAGETMDIGDASPPESLIKALIFDTYRTFGMFGQVYELRLCIGITKDELQFKFDQGPDALLARLRQAGVYPYTDLNRSSVLPATL